MLYEIGEEPEFGEALVDSSVNTVALLNCRLKVEFLERFLNRVQETKRSFDQFRISEDEYEIEDEKLKDRLKSISWIKFE